MTPTFSFFQNKSFWRNSAYSAILSLIIVLMIFGSVTASVTPEDPLSWDNLESDWAEQLNNDFFENNAFGILIKGNPAISLVGLWVIVSIILLLFLNNYETIKNWLGG